MFEMKCKYRKKKQNKCRNIKKNIYLYESIHLHADFFQT
jgi:hypothetical protein